MTEVRFYHLLQDVTTKVVPEILGKALARDMKALLKVENAERAAFYDDWLWRFQSESFLAHGKDGDPHPEKQPVWISVNDQAPNQATMAMVVEDAELPPLADFKLVCLIFDSENPHRLERARKLWVELKKQDGLTLTYWQQQDNGSWKKKDV